MTRSKVWLLGGSLFSLGYHSHVIYDASGGTENAGLEKSGLENAGTSCAWVAKCNIINVRGHVRVNATAGRGTRVH